MPNCCFSSSPSSFGPFSCTTTNGQACPLSPVGGKCRRRGNPGTAYRNCRLRFVFTQGLEPPDRRLVSHVCMHARIHARIHACTCVRTRTHARTHASTHARTHAHTHARTHARTHTRTHARTHTHTHTLFAFFPRPSDLLTNSSIDYLPH